MRPYSLDLQREIVKHAHAVDVGRLVVAGLIRADDDGDVLLIRRNSTAVTCGHSWGLPQADAEAGDLLGDLADDLFARYLGSEHAAVRFHDPRISADRSRMLVPVTVNVDAAVIRELVSVDGRNHIAPGRENECVRLETNSAHVLEAVGGFSFH